MLRFIFPRRYARKTHARLMREAAPVPRLIVPTPARTDASVWTDPRVNGDRIRNYS